MRSWSNLLKLISSPYNTVYVIIIIIYGRRRRKALVVVASLTVTLATSIHVTYAAID
jgi:hypothetical protein